MNPAGASRDEKLLDALERLMFAGVGVTLRSLEAVVGAGELTLGQWRILALVQGATQAPRLGDIALMLGMSVSSASRMVARLNDRHLIEAAMDAEDGRAVRIRLTRKGSDLAAAVVERRRRILAAAVGGLEVSGELIEELRSLTSAIETVRELGTNHSAESVP